MGKVTRHTGEGQAWKRQVWNPDASREGRTTVANVALSVSCLPFIHHANTTSIYSPFIFPELPPIPIPVFLKGSRYLKTHLKLLFHDCSWHSSSLTTHVLIGIMEDLQENGHRPSIFRLKCKTTDADLPYAGEASSHGYS